MKGKKNNRLLRPTKQGQHVDILFPYERHGSVAHRRIGRASALDGDVLLMTSSHGCEKSPYARKMTLMTIVARTAVAVKSEVPRAEDVVNMKDPMKVQPRVSFWLK